MASTKLLDKVLWRGEVDGSTIGGDTDLVELYRTQEQLHRDTQWHLT